MTNRNYGEGTLFFVPLAQSLSVIGLIARIAPRKRIAFGYFFASQLPSYHDANPISLSPQHALFSLRFGDLALWRGTWPVIGQMPGWMREDWPMHDTVRRDPLGHMKPCLVRYDDKDPSRLMSETTIENDDAHLRTDGLAGAGYVEALASRMLRHQGPES